MQFVLLALGRDENLFYYYYKEFALGKFSKSKFYEGSGYTKNFLKTVYYGNIIQFGSKNVGANLQMFRMN